MWLDSQEADLVPGQVRSLGEAALRGGAAVTSQARCELEQAFLRLLRAREPNCVWRVLSPNELDAILDGGTLAGARSGSDDRAVKDRGK